MRMVSPDCCTPATTTAFGLGGGRSASAVGARWAGAAIFTDGPGGGAGAAPSTDWAGAGDVAAGALAGAAGGGGSGAVAAAPDDALASVGGVAACTSPGGAGFSTGFGCSFAACGACAGFASA